jgi:hypothetical protein
VYTTSCCITNELAFRRTPDQWVELEDPASAVEQYQILLNLNRGSNRTTNRDIVQRFPGLLGIELCWFNPVKQALVT